MKVYTETPEQFAGWVKENINEIAKKCGWAEISAISSKPLVMNNQENTVVNITIIHTDDVKTYLMCEVANDGLPFSAVLESFIVMNAIQTIERMDGRIVIVSPSISERIVKEVYAKCVPVNFLMINPEQCKFWSYANQF